MPKPGYWQQDVHYKIRAIINEKRDIIEAQEKLSYWNNSPDELNELYFHLYQNAFTKGSYLDQLRDGNGSPVINYGPYSVQGLGTIVQDFKVDGALVKPEIDNTVMKIPLKKPLKPGESVDIEMLFATFFDSRGFRRRMASYDAWGNRHYNGVHWYPRIAVYDAKKGWDRDQHLNKELYGDFGTFDVQLNFSDNYVVEATGELQNPEETFPGDLRQRLDIKNFKDKAWDSKPSIITPYDSAKRKTWHYVAHNVHDFAFTADPTYRLGEETWNGVKCIAIVQEPHCSGWQNAPKYMTGIIKTFSEDFGMYEYPKIVAADARDGMEYPMITLDGGRDPSYRGLLVHEIGHNWFFGMIGNNETYRAALDEGFTQFLTAWGLNELDGDYIPTTKDIKKWRGKYKNKDLTLDSRVYRPYIEHVVRADDARLNTHSNDFGGNLGHGGGYRLVYYKTATMLYNLKYMLGDEMFSKVMKTYVHDWKIAHPYFQDFRGSVAKTTGQDLDWFFDQWLETTKYLDYKVKKVKSAKVNDKYDITLERKGEMQMPIELRVTSKKGEVFDYLIPNTDYKKPSKATTLPKWYGWSVLNKEYTFSAKVPGGIKSVEIDPTNQLADAFPMNNAKSKGSLFNRNFSLELDRGVNQPRIWNQYKAYWRPDVWYNAVDGTKLGLHMEGSHLNIAKNFGASLWWNTHLPQGYDYRVTSSEGLYERHAPIGYNVWYNTPVRSTQNKLSWGFGSRSNDGFDRHYLETAYKLSNKSSFGLKTVMQYRFGEHHRDYLFYPQEWTSQRGTANNTARNIFAELNYDHQYRGNGYAGDYNFTFRLPVGVNKELDNFDYTYLQADLTHYRAVRKLLFRARLFGRYGVGSNIPTESALYMQGANPEEMMEERFTRSHGILPLGLGGFSSTSFSNVHQSGGLNLRGYNGYYAVDQDGNNNLYINYKGLSGASANLEIDLHRVFNIKPKLTRSWLSVHPYLFGDVGVISRGDLDFFDITNLQPANSMSKIRGDAGFGTAFTIKKWGQFDKLRPFTFRIDMPLFLSAPPFGQEYLDFRWQVGIGRSF